jgi:hypothetical protein
MVNKDRTILWQALLALICTGTAWTAEAGTLRAGAARVDITPTPDQLPFTAQGSRPIAPYTSIHDKVYSRAVYLDDGSTQVLFVVVDVVAIPVPEKFIAAVAKAAGLPESHVFMAASHTHSTPLVNYHVDLPYHVGTTSPQQAHEIDRLRDASAEAARQAKASLHPAKISFGRGTAWLNVNMENPQGPSDKSLDVLRIDGVDGTPIALLADYGVPSGVVSDNYRTDGGIKVSGDLFGITTALLESQSPKAPVVLLASAADGDQRAIIAGTLPKVGSVNAADAGDAQWAILDVMARNLANATLAVLQTLPQGASEVKIGASQKTITCPGVSYKTDEKTRKVSELDAAPVPVPLNLVTLNDIAVIGVGGNVYAAMGQKIKAASPFAQTTLIGGTSGSVGYILPDSDYGQYTHSQLGDPMKAGCAEKGIEQGLAEMMRAAKQR